MSSELERLEQLERDIKDAWLSMGIALKAIRDENLYCLRGFKTFEMYCRKHWKISRQMAYRRIESAEIATNIIKSQEQLNYSESTFSALSKVDKNKQQIAFDKACEIAVSSGAARVTAKDVERAVIEVNGGYSHDVLFAAQRWGFTEDTEKLNILQTWYDRSKDSDSKFWAVYHSGVIDPQDELPVCEFATATVQAITEVASRWKQAKILANSDFTPIIGIVNKADLMIDGMKIVTDSWQGKRVKIIVKILEDVEHEKQKGN